MSSRARFKARVRTIFAAVNAVSGLAYLWNSTVAKRGVRILVYHGVEIKPNSPFSVSLADFKAQMAYLASNSNVVALSEVRRWMQSECSFRKPAVVLTFDDGFRNNFELAAPVLRHYNLPATFFLVSGMLGKADNRFMDSRQARELLTFEGFSIGSHTVDHKSVARVEASESDFQIAESKVQLEREIGQPIELFCYPYGTFNDFSSSAVESLKRHRYLLACTSINGVNLRSTDPFRLRRTKVEWSDGLVTFKRLLGGALDGWFFVDYLLRWLQKPRAVQFADTLRDPGDEQ
jgi:peptidoglycan/xylan/chitin deacetylase (PgdA/CDA1 family)